MCGGDLRLPAGAPRGYKLSGSDNPLWGEFSYEGCYGSLSYDFELWEARFCESCAVKIRQMITDLAAARGRGVTETNSLEKRSSAAAARGRGVTNRDRLA